MRRQTVAATFPGGFPPTQQMHSLVRLKSARLPRAPCKPVAVNFTFLPMRRPFVATIPGVTPLCTTMVMLEGSSLQAS